MWSKVFIVLTILRICIKIEKLNIGMRSMYTHISGCNTFNFAIMSSLIATGRRRRLPGQSCHHIWLRMSESASWMCTSTFLPPPFLCILCSAILAMKSAMWLTFTNYSRMSVQCSFHISMPWKLNSRLSILSDCRAQVLDLVLCFLHCGAQKPSLCTFGPIESKVHVGLF